MPGLMDVAPTQARVRKDVNVQSCIGHMTHRDKCRESNEFGNDVAPVEN